MTYSLALPQPETPVREEWEWLTDTSVSYAGNEDHIPLRRFPRRMFRGRYEFDRVEDVRRHLALMARRFGGLFQLPLYHQQTKLKAAASAGDTVVLVNALRSDLRVGRLALVIEGDTSEQVAVDAVAAGSVTFTTPLVNDYSSRALVCPITSVYTGTGAVVTRGNKDDTGSAGFTYMEHSPWTPFVDPLNDQALTLFDGMAVLDRPAIGTEFAQALDTGIRVTDYIGIPDVFSPWEQSQWTFSLQWLANRLFDPESWLWWYVFADHVRGSSTTFLLPTQRADLEVVTPVAGGGSAVTVAGDEYSQHYWGLDTFRRIVIDTAAGRHYATVTAVSAVAGNDRLTFTPALPNGAGWNEDQSVEFLLKARIADDRVAADHFDTHTLVSINVRTVE